jgi:hypothetical protein
MVYEVRNARGRKTDDGALPLRSDGHREDWRADIPAQRPGSTITYYFRLSDAVGHVFRHPAREPSAYRFRILPLQVLGVTLPEPGTDPGEGFEVAVHVRAVSLPSGAMVIRSIPRTADGAVERRIPMSASPEDVDTQARPCSSAVSPIPILASPAYVLRAALPGLQRGQGADLYFEIRLAGRKTALVPPDAPAGFYRVKRPFRKVQRFPPDQSRVTGLGDDGCSQWVGLGGQGLQRWREGRLLDQWRPGSGLLSGMVRFVLTDPASGLVHAGTDREVLTIDSSGALFSRIVAPRRAPRGIELDETFRVGPMRGSGPAALSSLDGELLFQVEGDAGIADAQTGAASLLTRDGVLDEWRPKAETRPVRGMTAAAFDPVDGCWLLGRVAAADRLPEVVRRCGADEETIVLRNASSGASRIVPRRIVALARDPLTGGLVTALEFVRAADESGRSDFGVYRIDPSSGEIAPLRPEVAALGVGVTALCSDWRRGRVLLGTQGKGFLQVEDGRLSPASGWDDRAREVTSIGLDPFSGALLVGTTIGAFERSDRDARFRRLADDDALRLPPDALPMDVNAASGRVLLSSYSGGVFELERAPGGRWRAGRAFRPGVEIPSGLFGDALYSGDGGLSVVMLSQGLLRTGQGQPILLGPESGLLSTHILRFLKRSTGEIWLAYLPMPVGRISGGAVQVLRDGGLRRTMEIADRRVGSIARWIEVPERDAVFAATAAGVVEMRSDGSLARLSTSPAATIARDAATGAVGAAGVSVERWDGGKFVPFHYRLDAECRGAAQGPLGSPIDLTIDASGIWHLLFRGGILVTLSPKGECLGVMGPEDGVPRTAQRLLIHPSTRDLFVGSSHEGPVVLLVAE